MFMKQRMLAAALGSLVVIGSALVSIAPASAGSGPVPPTPVPGTAYVVDGQTHTLWAIPPGGGERVAVADISAPTINDPNCADNYQWGAAVLGNYVYWPDDCGGIFRTSVLTGQTNEVMAAGYQGANSYGYITTDPYGNLWATADKSMLVEFPAATGQPVVYHTTGASFDSGSGIAWSQGYLYVEGATIQRFADGPSSSWSSPIALATYATIPGPVSNWSYDGFTADAAGDLFWSNGSNIYEVSASTQAVTLVPQSCTTQGIENLTYWTGHLYFSSWRPGYVCEFSSDLSSASVYSTTANPSLDHYYSSTSGWYSTQFNPEGFGFYGAATAVSPLDVRVNQVASTVSATWSNTGNFVCTLMYGFATPSSFSERVTGTSCTFTNFSPTTPYGIRVSGVGGGSVTSFEYAAPTTITCVRARHHRRVTAINPVCPMGWRRR